MSATDPHHATHRTIEAVWRIESARVIAGLTRLTRDVGLAEDLAQEALVAALEQWPQSGVPDNPAAWLTATAKRRAIDLFRRNAVAERKDRELARELEALEQTSPDLDSTLGNTISDDLLRLGLILAELTPTEPEVHGLVALMEIQASRTRAYKLGRHLEARTEFERAAAHTRNTRERDLLLTRAASCETDPTNP